MNAIATPAAIAQTRVRLGPFRYHPYSQNAQAYATIFG